MRNARALLQDWSYVRPPRLRNCFDRTAFQDTQRPELGCYGRSDGGRYSRRYTAKAAELRQTDFRIDWSEVTSADGPRRIALRHSELIGEPV